MKVLLQRVNRASVAVEGSTIGSITQGLLLLVGFGDGDGASQLSAMASKISHLRIFPDERGRFDRSLLDIGGSALAVPQFTLYGDTSKGRRPEFFKALKPELATALFEEFVTALRASGVQRVETGRFGAHMQVLLENDGPVTLMLEG